MSTTRDYTLGLPPPLRLHLGCQNNYLKGYINIDLPVAEQTIEPVRADLYCDVRDLTYPSNTIAEIRAHHLLEHFSRTEALVLLSRWHRWLKSGGRLIVETPDFEAAVHKFISGGLRDQFAIGRHLFGSQEAAWANHLDFWYEDKFQLVLTELGYGDFRFERFSNNIEQKLRPFRAIDAARYEPILKKFGTLGFNVMPNIICSARKTISDVDYEMVIYDILSLSLIGRERQIIDVWMKEVFGKI